jgi:o-succinylbenzoate synthase
MTVRIAAASLRHYRLPLARQWATAAGGFSARAGWLLQLRSDDGRYAYGDCAPLPALSAHPECLGESALAAELAVHGWCRQLPGRPVDAAFALLDAASGAATPSARCALETALLDLEAQAAGETLRCWLLKRANEGLVAPQRIVVAVADDIAVNSVVGALARGAEAELDGALDEAVAAALHAGFTTLKLKVGIAAPALEISRLRALCARLPEHVAVRLDANGAWNDSDAAFFIDACAGLPIDSIEEPLATPDIAALARLQQGCAFALAIDESWPHFAADAFFAAAPVRRLIIKPPRLGGLLPALTLARQAAAAGVEVVVTSSVDSACGVLAAAQLAAAIDAEAAPTPALAHGLATSCWLAADTGTPPPVAGGRLRLPAATGLAFMPFASPAPR